MAIFNQTQFKAPVKYFTDGGHAEDKDADNVYYRHNDDEFVFAKMIPSDSFIRDMVSNAKVPKASYDYMVRLAPDLKTVYDPRIKHCIPDKRPDFVTKICKDGEKPLFTKVNESVFQKYLLFLGNQSDAQYKECNRLVFGL